MIRVRRSADEFVLSVKEHELLPIRFHRFDGDRVLLTNLVGEHLFLSGNDFARLMERTLDDQHVLRRLRAKHMIRTPDDPLPVDLLAMKARTRYRLLSQFTSLHIFVVTLRCDHGCRYCQVSRQNADRFQYDMDARTAERALAATFASPSRAIKIEFQGGEPLLNFELVRQIVVDAERMNIEHGKDVSFVIATNLALLDDEILRFCADHGVYFSTSLDGPSDLHNRSRPRPGGDSWELTVAGIHRIQAELGPDRVAALMTTTEASLGRVREIIDCYVEHGLNDIFLRPVSPYGFAVKTKTHGAYDADGWLAFYREGVDYILELNRRGIPITERFARIVLKKMLTNDDPRYVDLMSPAGIGIGALVYNYDGDVYASDEARMLAEMGDTTFRLGNLESDSLAAMLTSEALLAPLEESFSGSAPMCSDCAFEPYCGSDPVYHHATAGDFLGRKPDSAFCRRSMGVFEYLLDRYEADPHARGVFRRWAAA